MLFFISLVRLCLYFVSFGVCFGFSGGRWGNGSLEGLSGIDRLGCISFVGCFRLLFRVVFFLGGVGFRSWFVGILVRSG